MDEELISHFLLTIPPVCLRRPDLYFRKCFLVLLIYYYFMFLFFHLTEERKEILKCSSFEYCIKFYNKTLISTFESKLYLKMGN